MSQKDSSKAGEQAAVLLAEIDKSYDDFVKKSITSIILKENNFNIDQEELSRQVLQYLKPYIDALIAHINMTSYASVKINYSSPFFRNISSLIELMFQVSQSYKDKKLSHEDRNEIYSAFSDGIKSDIISRVLDLKSGDVI